MDADPWGTSSSEIALRHGENRISRVLRLEFNHLKRMAESGGRYRPRERVRRAGRREAVGPKIKQIGPYGPNANASSPRVLSTISKRRCGIPLGRVVADTETGQSGGGISCLVTHRLPHRAHEGDRPIPAPA